MITLSLDQASRTTGWSVFEDNKLKDYGKFDYNDQDIGVRLNKIRNKVKELTDTYSPDQVIFEEIQLQNNVGNNVQTFKILAMVYGVIAELLAELGIPNKTILASSWKSKLGIKGKTRAEQKKNAQQYVLDNYNIKVIQDIADAVCIGAASLKTTGHDWTD